MDINRMARFHNTRMDVLLDIDACNVSTISCASCIDLKHEIDDFKQVCNDMSTKVVEHNEKSANLEKVRKNGEGPSIQHLFQQWKWDNRPSTRISDDGRETWLRLRLVLSRSIPERCLGLPNCSGDKNN